MNEKPHVSDALLGHLICGAAGFVSGLLLGGFGSSLYRLAHRSMVLLDTLGGAP